MGFEMVKERFSLAVDGKASMYKLIFLDFSMPDMDGPEVSRVICAFFKANETY